MAPNLNNRWLSNLRILTATTRATDLVMTPLRMALWKRDREGHPVEPKSLISHSDAGSQYSCGVH